MKKIRTFFAVFNGLLFLSIPSFADLKVSNKTDDIVAVAIGYIDNNIAVSKGWFILGPRETKTVIAGHLPDRHYYYYFTSSSPLHWSGTDAFFISSSPTFMIQGTNFGTFKEVKQIQFRRADIINSVDDYTIIIGSSTQPLPRTAAIPIPKAPDGKHQTKGADNRNKKN